MIRVAVDAQCLNGKRSGLGVYTASLLQAIQSLNPADIDITLFPEMGCPYASDLNTLQRLRWEITGFPDALHSKGFDLAHVPAFACGWPKIKTILTVHDLIGVVFPNQKGIASRFYWKHWLPWAVKRADCIISVSENTKNDLIRLLRISEKKIKVIKSSGHERFSRRIPADFIARVLSEKKINSSYFLCVGTMEPRKNFERIAQAFDLFIKRSGSDARLVWVGSQEFAHGKFYAELMLRFSASADQIIAAGYLSDEELGALYQGAVGLVFPSLYEGFGLPVLEAMGAGCPVITSNTSSLPEVGGDAALYVDPQSPESIARAMEILYSDASKRQALINVGHQRTQVFSWDKTARETFNLYREVAYGN